MARINHCYERGYLVDGKHHVPSNPTEHFFDGLWYVYGCNRLGCARCGCHVRQQAGVGLDRRLTPVEVDAAYSEPTLSSLPALSVTEDVRLYLCRCSYWLEHDLRSLTPDEGPVLPPWRCVGHPAPRLPIHVDGVDISTEESLRLVVEGPLSGRLPPQAHDNERRAPCRWLLKVYGRLATSQDGAGLAESLAQAVFAQVSGPPAVRANVLAFFAALPTAPGGDALLDLVRGDRALFADVAHPDLGGTLEDSLMLFVSRRVAAADTKALEVARDEVTGGRRGATLLVRTLSVMDLEWVAAHLEAIVRAQPRSGNALFDALVTNGSPRIAELGGRLARLPEVDKQELEQQILHRALVEPIRSGLLATLREGT
jgi:hypothetical protein